MRVAMIGLGKMGGNMARRLRRHDIEVVGFSLSADAARSLADEVGVVAADSLTAAVAALPTPRMVWLMLPSGNPTEATVQELTRLLEAGDIVIDGGNSNYHDSVRRGALLAQHGIAFVDVGTSGGVWGLDNGYCLMAGGDDAALQQVKPLLQALAPAPDRGWAHVGPVGAGHFVKMVHNGIEYGMMQAFAEGFALMRSKQEFKPDLAQVAEVWRHSSVIRSWLLDLTADALAQDQELKDIAPVVADSGEGRWTALEAIEQGVPLPVITLALQMRFASQDGEGYPAKLLALMRNGFGGHNVEKR